MNVWRDRLQAWFTPLAQRIPLSPNAITVIALLINVAAAAALASAAQRPSLFVAGVVLLTIGGLADALDGIVARVRGLESAFGDFLDHCADRLSDVLLAAGWCIGSGVAHWITLTVAIAVLLNGYVGTQLEATWHARDYTTVGRGEFVLALVVYPIVSYILADNGWGGVVAGAFTIAELMALLLIAFAVLGIVQRIRLAASLETTPR